MKKQLFKRSIAMLLALCMVLSFIPAASAAPRVTWKETDLKIEADMTDRLIEKDESNERDPSEMVRVSIVLEGRSTVEAGYATMGIGENREAMAYRADLRAVQERLEKTISVKVLNGRPLDVVWNMTLVGNIISAWVPYGKIEAIEALPGVEKVALEARYEPCVAQVDEGVLPTTYPSSGMIGSGKLWEGGYTGAGSRIAVVDTGTDIDHQSFDNGAYLYALQQNAAEKGMTFDAYKASLDLLTVEEIAAVLPDLNVHDLDASITAEQLYGNEKLAFGYNYVDANLNITHLMDQQGEHGSHVAGISTANRYVDRFGSYQDAAANVMMVGVAPDAQLITMKVFGEESPYDSDYMAAIEDAILLNCDVVNLSLGSTAPGSPYTDVYSDLMELMKTTDTVVAIAAGNASNWAATTMWGYLYNDDVSFDEVGSPGSYESAFTVASVQNDGTVGYYFTANGQKAFYVENLNYGNTPMSNLDKSLDLDGTEYEYVFLDGLGYEDEYAGIDITGKVVFVQRGELNFAVKANNALSRGAIGVVVYNNQAGVSNMDLTGLSYEAPVVSITQAEGAAIRAASEDHGTYLSGKLTVYGLMGAAVRGSEYYTMSDFSSWGVPSSLTLKPEITAPGGQIYSVWGSNTVTGGGTDKYETMSGTSMATPQIAGMAALLAQYFRENDTVETAGISARHLAQSLLMSTAQPLYEEASGGNYYSLLNQGAGLARVDLAAQAESYVLVSGQDDGKVKAELGDDPRRTGVYEFDFTITNMTDAPKSYALEADTFRQDVFEYMEDSDVWLLDTWTTGLEADVTFSGEGVSYSSGFDCDLNGDGVTNTSDADYLLEYLVGNESELYADGDLSGDGVANSYDAHLLLASLGGETVTVPAGGTVTITAQIALTDAARAELDAETPKGTYVEAFVYAKSIADAEGNVGTTHSIPVLAFYGDWSEPSMFDRGTLVEHIYLATNKGPYLYYFIGPYGNAIGIDYGSGNEYYYGGNPILDDSAYLPERNAFSSTNGSKLTEQTFTLIRGAGDARMQITNADTGEVYFERTLGELYPAYYNTGFGTWENTIQYAKLNWTGTDAAGKPLAEDTRVNVSLTAVPHYYRNEDGSYPFEGLGAGSTMTTAMTIDNTAPEALDIDISAAQEGRLTVKAKDNQYVAAVALLNAGGTKFLAVQSPNQTEKNADVTVELDITAVTGKKFLVAVYDYANNMRTYEVEMELTGPDRQYFTGINANTGTYVTMDMACAMTDLATLDIPTQARAAEYVDGYVFTVTSDNMLCVANDEDLTTTSLIGPLDPDNELMIDSVADMAYNYADEQMYLLVYSALNESMYPYLCTLDLTDGSLETLCVMPVDVHTLAIDGEGNCFSAVYGQPSLYTYTIEGAKNNQATYVGAMSYYGTGTACCMAWDHNTDELYFAFPDTLLKIDTETAEPTLIGYYTGQLLGLYIRTGEAPSGRFDPADRVDRIELSHTDTRVLLNSSMTVEATVWPWNASDRTVTWISSDESVATVDQNGTIFAHSLGECTITAISNLNPAKAAACTVSTFELEKTLNGLVWDENGEIWMSEFATNDLPNYTKLAEKSLGKDLASATLSQDGNLYAASLEVNGLKSELYKLDPETFQPTLIGPSTDGYVDLAPAPGQPGNSLMAVYGGNVMQVDAETGDYYNWYYMFSYNLVALAYVGTQEYKDWGYDTMVDWYFIIDRMGYVYLMGFLEQDGSYYYLEHDILAPGGIYTKLNFEMETPYFGSAYFDGEMLYFSAYKESRNNVTLMAVDVAGGSRACYEIGTFADGVWPVAGVMELGGFENHIDFIFDGFNTQTLSQPTPTEPQAELKGIRDEKAEGTLTNTAAPMSGADLKEDLVYVDVTVPVDTTNATVFVEYDASALELTGVSGMTTAFACKADGGKVAIAAAEGRSIPAETVLARLTFQPIAEGSTEIIIRHGECGAEYLELFESFSIDLGHKCPSEHFVDVNEGDWWHEAVDYVVEKGYMNGMDAAHFGPGVTMNRAQFVTVLYRMEGQPAVNNTGVFTDVPAGQFYTEAAYWALEKGITTGATATTFNPGGQLTRTELVTFMYRYAKLKGYDTSATADLSVFRDENEILSFAVEPWKWAVTHGIVTGVTPTTLAPMNLTNRAQAATIFQRLDSKFA